MNVGWLQAQLQGRADLSFWLGISMLLYFFSANLSGLLDRILYSTGRSSHPPWRAWTGWLWPLDILRWAYMIGLPYLLLVSGILSPSQIGLMELDWVGALRRGGILLPATLVLLLVAWRTFVLAMSGQDVVRGSGRRPLAIVCVTSVAEAAALQLHWAFYRAAAATLPWSPDLYWSAWLGAALILLLWALNPWVWKSLRHVASGERAARRGVLLIVSTALFLLMGNLWLNWLLHAAFECCTQRMSCSARANGEE